MLRNIVIDLDLLLDTRAGTLRRIIPLDELDKVINSQEYRTRTHERMWELCSITQQQWEDGWALRDEITLAFSKPTLAMADFPRLVGDLNSVVEGNNPGLSDVRFLINTYPYKLSDKTKQQIVSAIQYNFSTTCEVMSISLDYSRLSPAACKDRNIILMFIYDIMKYNQVCFPDDAGWAIDNLPTPNEELTIITPRIDRDYFNKRDEIKDLGVVVPHGISQFEISMELFQLIYGLEFVNTSYVCEVTEEVRERISKGYQYAKGNSLSDVDTSTGNDDDIPDISIPEPNVHKK